MPRARAGAGAKAERQIEREKAQLEGLKCVESMLRAELWNVENEYAEQREAWEQERSVLERERSVGCALCHPLVLRARTRAAGARVPTAGST